MWWFLQYPLDADLPTCNILAFKIISRVYALTWEWLLQLLALLTTMGLFDNMNYLFQYAFPLTKEML